MKKILSFALMLALCSCGSEATQTAEIAPSNAKEYETINTVRLTVAEGKKLIAKGLFANADVQAKLQKGMVIITRGTTNTYIAEEFVGYAGERGSLVTGKIIPTGKEDFTKGITRSDDLVIIDGKLVEMSYADALAKMSDGDIIFKGANLMNYSKSQAGICIGAPDGGTVARLSPYAKSGAARWIIPVGLEKDTSSDLLEISDMLALNSERRNKATLLWAVESKDIYTEIEAIKEFANVDVLPIANGGVAGAEGGVSLLICGTKAEVAKATAAAESVIGEGAFVK
ncbi:MAG: hypothetical protein SNH35_03910 [Rikenellaceae bacterium]